MLTNVNLATDQQIIDKLIEGYKREEFSFQEVGINPKAHENLIEMLLNGGRNEIVKKARNLYLESNCGFKP